MAAVMLSDKLGVCVCVGGATTEWMHYRLACRVGGLICQTS